MLSFDKWVDLRAGSPECIVVESASRRWIRLFRTVRLRTKFLVSLLAITAGMTAATLWVVSYSVEQRIRESLRDELRSSVKTYQTFAGQREAIMVRSAALVANLPNVRALMTTEDAVTIQEESCQYFTHLRGRFIAVSQPFGGNCGFPDEVPRLRQTGGDWIASQRDGTRRSAELVAWWRTALRSLAGANLFRPVFGRIGDRLSRSGRQD